ncbi:MAG: Ig-like domain-containing protein, partial [Chloroflexota bacterium]|nr:Ig-like domain-containing protein [Chloroflexota bacterium]
MAWRLAVATLLVLSLDAALLPFPAAAATTASAESWKTTTAAWGGTLNGANSAYAQGLTIPSRLVITGETAGVHTLVISYDFRDSSVGSNKHFMDFIENYDRTIQRSTADPCAGVTACGGSATTLGIPSDPTIPSQRAGVISVWNASSLSLSAYTTTSGGGAITKHITLLYTATAGANVVVAFGAHIASPTDWGTGNGASSWAGGSGKVGGTHDGGTEKIVGINPGAFGVATNTAPNVSSTSVSVNQNSSTSVTLSASDAEDCELTFRIVSAPSHGTLSAITNAICSGATGAFADTASVTYTPTAGYNGSDSFAWTANDGTIDGATATVSVTVNAVGSTSQTITFAQPASPATYGASFIVSPTSTSGLPVSVAASGGCTISGSTVTMTGGTTDCILVASQTGDGTYAAASNVTRTVGAARASQTITFAQPTSPATYGTSFSVSATSTSGLAVSVGASGGCTISGSTVTMTSGTIDCVVTASQSGDGNYAAATTVTRTVTARKADQTIGAMNAPASASYGTTLLPTATASSGLSVTFTASGACSAGVAITSGTGRCTITASQAGDANYNAAPGLSTDVTATLAHLTVTADDQTRESGAVEPTFTATVSGFVNGETLGTSGVSGSASCSTTATS